MPSFSVSPQNFSHFYQFIKEPQIPQNFEELTHQNAVIMAVVFPRLGGRAEALQRDKPDHLFRLWQPRGAGLVVAAVVLLAYIALNVAILVVVPQVSLTSDGKGQGLPGRYYAAVVFSLVGLALAYYAFVISDATTEHVERRPGGSGGNGEPAAAVVEKVEGLWGSKGFSLLSLAHVRCRIRKDLVYDADMERVRHFGRRWRAFYILRRDLRVSYHRQLRAGSNPPPPFFFFFGPRAFQNSLS